MKRLLLLSVIVAGATTLFCALRSETTRYSQTTARQREQQRLQTTRFDQMRIEREELRERVRELKYQAAAQAASLVANDPAEEFARDGLTNLTPEKTERLLAELGFNWNSPGDYLVVSKKWLPQISLSAVHAAQVTDAVRAALVITPDEQKAIEAAVQRTTNEYTSWLQTHVKREEPSGNILAKYVLESDPQFSQSMSNLFANAIVSSLGTERAALFQEYASDWMNSLGMFGSGATTLGNNQIQTDPTRMTIRRENKYLMMELRQANSSMTCGITPWQPFPEAFSPLFPGGWKELAEREGFELPPEFQKK
jgi:hypothetical protein